MAQQSAKTIRTVGLDFGTTNSAQGRAYRWDGAVSHLPGQRTGPPTFRSVLYLAS